MSWYVYMIRLSDHSLYTGITTNVLRRMEEHSAGKGSKYVRSRLPIVDVVHWPCEDRSIASRIESFIKKLSKKDKEELFDGGSKTEVHPGTRDETIITSEDCLA